MSDTIFFIGAGTELGLLIVRTLLDKGYAVYAGIRDPEGRNAERSQKISAMLKVRAVRRRPSISPPSTKKPAARPSTRSWHATDGQSCVAGS